MTPEFTEAFQQRLESLIIDLRYYNKTTGTTIAPRIYKTMLPDLGAFVVGQEKAEADYSPVVCWGINGGEMSRGVRHPIEVGLIGVISVDESLGDSLAQIQSGSEQIEELAMALAGLVDNCFFAGFKLQLPIKFSLGLPGVGGERMQPHPTYVVHYTLSFLNP